MTAEPVPTIVPEGARVRRETVQFAALAFDLSGPVPRYLLVTSKRTGRWIFPKGAARPGEAGWQAAVREAREEAGVVGTGIAREIGRYRSLKIRPGWVQPLDVRLFPVAIERLTPDWREKGMRRRRLAPLDEVLATVAQPDMAALCRHFHDMENPDARAAAR